MAYLELFKQKTKNKKQNQSPLHLSFSNFHMPATAQRSQFNRLIKKE